MAPPIVNTEYYYVLKNRIHRFNTFYADQLKFGLDDRITDDIFECLHDAWVTVSMDTKGDAAKNLDAGVVISEESFEQLKEGAIGLKDRLIAIAVSKQLGERYYDENGREYYDYTYVSHEILEICVLAMYTYTNFFQQCKYIENYGVERDMGPRRAKEIAKAMFPAELKMFEVQEKSRQLFDNPLHNVKLEMDREIYKDGTNYQITFNDSNDRIPYKEVKEQHDREKQAEYKRTNEEIERKKQDKEEQLRQQQILAEQNRIIYENRMNPEMGDYSVYDSFRHAFDVVPDDDPPDARHEHFYAFFKKLGIDEKDLTAQTLIKAMYEVHNEMANDPDDLVFCEKVLPIYRQLQAFAFEVSAKESIAAGTKVDLNSTARKVDEVMAALYCTVNALGAQRGDTVTRRRAAELINGTYHRQADPKLNAWIRAAAIDRVKAYYREEGIEALNENAKSRLDYYRDSAMTSSGIASYVRHCAEEYTRYQEAIRSNSLEDGAFEQAMARGFLMDEAYALEKRIETRYASVWSKIFRVVSYLRQANALSKVKTVLGIDQNTRIADAFVEDRLNNIAKDFSDPAAVDFGRIRYDKDHKTKVTEHILAVLKLSLPGKDIPHAEDLGNVIEESGQSELDCDGDIKTTHSEYLKEQARIEEEKRLEKERLEKERLEREKAEREKAEEEERLRLEKEVERVRREKLALAEKEELYNLKVDDLEVKIEKLTDIYNKFAGEERANNELLEKRANEIPDKISMLETEKSEIPVQIEELRVQEANILQSLSEKIKDLTDNEISDKDIRNAEKEARGHVQKQIGDQGLASIKRVAEQLENNEVVKVLQGALSEINKQIAEKQARIPKIDIEIRNLWSEHARLKNQISKPSSELTTTASELKKLKDEYNYMKENKDAIIMSGEGLGFHEELFFEGENFKVRDSILRPSNWQPSDRYTVIVDGVDDARSLPLSEPVEDTGRESQISISM